MTRFYLLLLISYFFLKYGVNFFEETIFMSMSRSKTSSCMNGLFLLYIDIRFKE